MAPPATPRERRLLLDTNVVVGALLWSGPPLRLMEQAVEDGIELISSPVLPCRADAERACSFVNAPLRFRRPARSVARLALRHGTARAECDQQPEPARSGSSSRLSSFVSGALDMRLTWLQSIKARAQGTMGFGKWFCFTAGAVLDAVTSCATACSLAPPACDLAAFLKERDPTQVVALAKVVAVEDLTPRPRMVSEQNVQFEVLRLWLGNPQSPVVASVGVAEPSGMSCDGIGNLRMELGRTWLLVGNDDRGVLRPSALKSKHLVDGVLPPETSKLLQLNE